MEASCGTFNTHTKRVLHSTRECIRTSNAPADTDGHPLQFEERNLQGGQEIWNTAIHVFCPLFTHSALIGTRGS